MGVKNNNYTSSTECVQRPYYSAFFAGRSCCADVSTFTSLAEIKEQKMTHISRLVASVAVSRVSTNSYAVGSLSVAKQLNTMEGKMYQQSSIWPSFPSIGM